MKFKPNQTRIYDGEGFKRRAACLCFKDEEEDEVSAASRAPQWTLTIGASGLYFNLTCWSEVNTPWLKSKIFDLMQRKKGCYKLPLIVTGSQQGASSSFPVLEM